MYHTLEMLRSLAIAGMPGVSRAAGLNFARCRCTTRRPVAAPQRCRAPAILAGYAGRSSFRCRRLARRLPLLRAQPTCHGHGQFPDQLPTLAALQWMSGYFNSGQDTHTFDSSGRRIRRHTEKNPRLVLSGWQSNFKNRTVRHPRRRG
jgi:hypothetical protein